MLASLRGVPRLLEKQQTSSGALERFFFPEKRSPFSFGAFFLLFPAKYLGSPQKKVNVHRRVTGT